MNYEDIEGPDQTVNMGGLTQRFYFARKKDFLVLQKPITNPTTLDEVVEIATAHTFKTGKCFLQGYCTADKGKIDLESQGERDGRSFKVASEVFVPGSELEVHGFAATAINDEFIALKEMPDGTHMQIGDAMFSASINPKFSTGTNASGIRGYTFTFEAMNSRPLIYTGAISLVPAP